MFLFSSTMGLSAADVARLRRVERKLDLVLKHLGIAGESDPSDPAQWPTEITQPADAGRKIEAIKAHRELFGSNLREAKEAVEAYMGR
jgi:ribosomal protein L7/L12